MSVHLAVRVASFVASLVLLASAQELAYAQMAYDGSILGVEADDLDAPPGMFHAGHVVSPEADATGSVAAAHPSQGFFRLRVVCRDVNGNILDSASTLVEIEPGESDDLNVSIDTFTCPFLSEYYVDAILTVHDPGVGGDPPPYELVAFDSVMYVLAM